MHACLHTPPRSGKKAYLPTTYISDDEALAIEGQCREKKGRVYFRTVAKKWLERLIIHNIIHTLSALDTLVYAFIQVEFNKYSLLTNLLYCDQTNQAKIKLCDL